MYKDVEIDAGRMWKVRTKIVQVIIGELEAIKIRKFSCSQTHLSATELQKITLLCAAQFITKLRGLITLISY